ncbi:hypothetical protein [Paenibacillus sp. L3-i20]|uniref:hypothetical protein n=1 Tax=Paenibacillus sp. L3-i20 TaxID=2905833 RepID=UPI001EDDF4F5|nr:hypothetical protein [Paenibacillus sp. L3-i20]GKU80490.1 hypothetical protein L3i20_v248870 [Paenibacillus sp. L3-i20]
MNKDSNINSLIQTMRETKIPEVDIASKVMQNVHSLNDNHRIQKRKRLRMSPVWFAICALVFISTASVSAAALFNTKWNGIQVSISENGTGTSIPADSNEQSYKEKLETALSTSADVWETVAVDEAVKQSSFPLLRPQESKFTLVKSFGVVQKDTNYRVQSADEWYLGGFYDIFLLNQTDIVVEQDLNVEMTKTLKDPSKTLSMTYRDGPWENVQISDDVLAMFTGNGNDNYLVVNYKTADLNVISLEISGDVTKDDLVALAKTYLGK